MKTAVNGSMPRIIVHTDACECPTCGSTVSPEVYAAIIGEMAARDAEIERAAESRFATREAIIRQEATAAANAAAAGKIAKAETSRKTAEQAVKAAKADFDRMLREKLTVQDEAAAKARVEAVNAVTEKFFGENLRLQERVLELQRMLDKKQPQERGDILEMDIVEALIAEFPQDQIACERVQKGKNGADIAVKVFSKGVCVGTVAVECKSVRRWSNAWVPKLKRDMAECGASHGVLITAAFPGNEHQLAVRDGVIIAAPARALAVIHILRRAIIQFHALRLSNADRDEKTGKLYDLLTGEPANERWSRLSSAASSLVEIETADAAHQLRTRDKRLTKVRTIIAVHDEFVGDIEAILRGEPGDMP